MIYDFHEFEYESIFEENQNLKVISIGQVENDYTQLPRAMHMHENRLELILISQGNGVHVIDGQTYYIAKGDLLIYNSGVLHEEISNQNQGMSKYYCSVSGLKLKGLNPNALVGKGGLPVYQCQDYYDEIAKLFELLYVYSKREQRNIEYVKMLVKALLIEIVTMIEAHSDKEKGELHDDNENWELDLAIKQYVDRNYRENITLKSIADQFGISQYYVSHLFKSSTGFSPIQYVIRRRIGEAQSYLMDDDISVAEIAEIVGYNNLNHFYNAFTKCVGISPGKYRRNFKGES